MHPKDAEGIANSVDPDQTVLVCIVCPDLSVRKLRNITGINKPKSNIGVTTFLSSEKQIYRLSVVLPTYLSFFYKIPLFVLTVILRVILTNRIRILCLNFFILIIVNA